MKHFLSVTFPYLIVGFLLGSIVGHTYSRKPVTAITQQLLVQLNSDAFRYSDYNTTNKDKPVAESSRHPCDYSAELQAAAKQNFFENHCDFWTELQIIKTHFHETSLQARAVAPPKVLSAINDVDAGLDEVFTQAVHTEYYGRMQPDVYDAVMRPKIANLETAIRGTVVSN